MKPVFYLLAGPNGVGKSTLYRFAVASGLLAAQTGGALASEHLALAGVQASGLG